MHRLVHKLTADLSAMHSSIMREDFSAYVPQVRPHNHRSGRKLFFMLSKTPIMELSEDKVRLYEGIDGTKNIGEIMQEYSGASERLLKWHEANIIELIPPSKPRTGPHVVVVEPHMDDAVLSTGGRMLRRRSRGRLTILSAVKWSNFTSYLLRPNGPCLDVNEISHLREQESHLAARLLAAESRCLDWTDAPLRFCPADQWSASPAEKFRVFNQVFAKTYPHPNDVSVLAEQLTQYISELRPTELWIPMGLGDHVDHRTTRSACLLMLAESLNRFSSIDVSMYEDLPYAVYATN